jgi:hypothetical protein
MQKRFVIETTGPTDSKPPAKSTMSSKNRCATLRSNLSVALSGEFRESLSALPLFAAMNPGIHSMFEHLSQGVQVRRLERMQWPVRIGKTPAPGRSLADRYATVQARRWFHSPAQLATTLGWKPPLSYERGPETLVAWLRFAGVAA